jgi:PadR family transcriptional regulator, regulatory protein PadR
MITTLCSILLVIAYYIAMNAPRLSHTAALILKAISLGYCYGLDVMEITGLPSGTVYPALRRLERDEFVESKWEPEEQATAKQRPARRYYEVTREGKAAALAATLRYPLLAHLVPEKRS